MRVAHRKLSAQLKWN